jgi:hypothetical protein
MPVWAAGLGAVALVIFVLGGALGVEARHRFVALLALGLLAAGAAILILSAANARNSLDYSSVWGIGGLGLIGLGVAAGISAFVMAVRIRRPDMNAALRREYRRAKRQKRLHGLPIIGKLMPSPEEITIPLGGVDGPKRPPTFTCQTQVRDDGRVAITLFSSHSADALQDVVVRNPSRALWVTCRVQEPVDLVTHETAKRQTEVGRRCKWIYPDDFGVYSVPDFPLHPGLYGVRFGWTDLSSHRRHQLQDAGVVENFQLKRTIPAEAPTAKRVEFAMDAHRLALAAEDWLRTFNIVRWPSKGEDQSKAEEEAAARNKRAASEFAERFGTRIESLHTRAKGIDVLDSGVERHYNLPRDFGEAQLFPQLLRDWAGFAQAENAK